MSMLRRYTSLPHLLHMLHHGRITLGDPTRWDDKNDSALIEAYRRKLGLKKVFALCFAECRETYHHWKIYADGASGVCIEFDKKAFLELLDERPFLKKKNVKYCRLDSISDYSNDVEMWPFLKRLPYEGEKEFRIIVDYNEKESISYYPLSFAIRSIEHIYLSPWLSRDIVKSIEKVIHRIPDCEELLVTRTGLVDNQNWKATFNDQ
jgi:hypothetical protein